MNGPASWKTKCAVRRADDVAMTAGGTLILRRDSLPPLPALESEDVDWAGQTARMPVPSLAPFALDLPDEEDFFPPARNSDALGLRTTQPFDPRSVTRGSFWAGLSAGLTAIACGAALAFVSFTSDGTSAPTTPRAPRINAHGHSSLEVIPLEVAVEKTAAAKKRVKRARVVDTGAAEADVEVAVESLPAPKKTTASDAAGAERVVTGPAPEPRDSE